MAAVPLDRDFNAANCVRTLITVTEALNEIVRQENNALANGRTVDFAAFQAEKARLAASHARSIRTLAAHRGACRAVDTSLLTDLRARTAAFEERMMRQRDLLAQS